MRYAIVSDRVVVNIVEAGADYATAKGWIAAPNGISIGWAYEDGEFSPPPPADLGALKTILKAEVDEGAETARLKYITAGSGQAMTYQNKADEATRCLADEDPEESDYPLLAAEIGITADDLAGVAAIVSASHAQWRAIGAAIEAARLGSKAAIDAAENESAARAAAAVNWP